MKGDLQKIAGRASPSRLEIRPRSTTEVALVLLASRELAWLASHQDALNALTNLKTLGWVIQAASVFDAANAASISPVTIADRLWAYWTDDKAAIKGLLTRLGARDAAFEHSVGLSRLDASDQYAFDQRPQQCPLRLNPENNHVQFEHDLAADWARFQQLKEIADDTVQWASYAENPLWYGALRMLGQCLLRRPVGERTAWDVAFDTVQTAEGRLPLAEDILLDALFLDPAAGNFLEQRAELLFANNARHLQRLLARFDHVGTASGVTPGNKGPLKDWGVYLEAKFRTPIVGRWPALANFLTNHRARVAGLVLPIVSVLSERWLTSLPQTWSGGSLVPYRKEFAELALATARERQLSAAKGDIYVGKDESTITAALAGAQDIPDEVAVWSLEMARRSPMRADLAQKLREYNDERAAEHKRKMENDAEYRERHERRHGGTPHFPSGRRLPPWPLGPRGRVDTDFSSAVLRSATFQRLIRVRPAVASEVLLAILIEDSPEEEYGSRTRMNDKLGLEYDHESYPTAYWKSPFFSFLAIDTSTALYTLMKLVSFCMDRWDHEFRDDNGRSPFPLTIRLSDGKERRFRGYYNVFAWSQTNGHSNGQLFSALAALEKWLCSLVNRDIDVMAHIENVLRNADSVAVLGVLINVGKRLPQLFRTVLKPLLATAQFYYWDEARVRNSAYSFDGMTWARSGDLVFDLARDWHAEPYRQKSLIEIVSELCREDHTLGDFVNAATQQWSAPQGDKERVEFQIRVAQLDYRNYTLVRNLDTGQDQMQFDYPADVRAAINGFDQGKRRARQVLEFSQNSRRYLAAPGVMSDDHAVAVAELMAAADGGEDLDLEEGMVRPTRVATAAALLLGAKTWLAGNTQIRDQAQRIMTAAMDEVAPERDRSRFFYTTHQSFLEFAAYYVFHEWLATPSPENDSAIMRLLTRGDDTAAGVITGLAFAYRVQLADRWWRLLYLGLLASGLLILKPRHDQKRMPQWLRWTNWLVSRRISGVHASIDDIRPLDLAKRVEEYEGRQWEEEYRNDGRRFKRDRSRRMSGGLETHFLAIVFAWLVAETALPADAGEHEQRRRLLVLFWAHQAWRLTGSESETSGDFAVMEPFGYNLLGAMAVMVFPIDVNAAASLWQPVFDLGPKGHSAIEYFLSSFFLRLEETTDVAAFLARWLPMIEAVLEGKGWESGPWYYQHRLERHVLGFANTDALARPKTQTPVTVSVRNLYKAWAEKRLKGDEDNLAGFCNFLSSKAGAPLRLDGLLWITDGLRGDTEGHRWHRDGTSSAFVGFLTTVVTENGPEAVATPETRQALIDLTGLAVSRQLSAALALQDRLTTLL